MTHYLTRAVLDRQAPEHALRPLLDPTDRMATLDAHRRLMWTLFPGHDAKRDFLWRADGTGKFWSYRPGSHEARGCSNHLNSSHTHQSWQRAIGLRSCCEPTPPGIGVPARETARFREPDENHARTGVLISSCTRCRNTASRGGSPAAIPARHDAWKSPAKLHGSGFPAKVTDTGSELKSTHSRSRTTGFPD